MYLTPYDLTPTYRNVHNKFSVRYSLNLVLVDQARKTLNPKRIFLLARFHRVQAQSMCATS